MMDGRRLCVLAVCFFCLTALSPALPSQPAVPEQDSTARLQQDFFSGFNLTASATNADQRLRTHPGDAVALFVRMETAALQQRTDSVLDSALRLCTMPAPPEIQEIASSRILENAGNSRVFRDVLRRVGLAMEEGNSCTFNLRLALVAAAADGAARLDLDKTAGAAGLLTHWRIAGPFGRFSNVDFDRKWPPESDAFWRSERSSAERFWFRDGMLSLPDYFSAPGVFYATADVRTGDRASQLDVLSPGPYIILIDGRQVLSTDSRYIAGPNRKSIIVHLAPGRHRVIVKFTSDATPFSADLHPAFTTAGRHAALPLDSPTADYVRALLAYFRGDLNEVERIVSGHLDDPRGPFLYLRALVWSAVDDRSPRVGEAWRSLAKVHPSAVLARAKSAEFALEGAGASLDDLRSQIATLVEDNPQSELVANVALHAATYDTDAETHAFEHLIDLHPACSYLSDALKFYQSTADPANADKAEKQLATCGPESLAYARVLSDSGRHNDAAKLLDKKVAANPLDRSVRRLLVLELMLAGHIDQARKQAQALHAIAPGSQVYAKLAADPAAVLDSNSQRATNFVSQAEFYAPYHDDGVRVAHASSAEKSLAGSPVAILLADRVLKIRRDGSASLYSHRVVRLLDRQSISRYGEIDLPRGSDLLELRTIKPDGRVIEPELTPQKPTISMPALESGDCIDEEFVTDYPDWHLLPQASALFEFGSVSTPVLRTRFVLITPKGADIKVEQLNGAPSGSLETLNDDLVRTWTMDHLPAVVAESFVPSGILPAIYVTAAENTLDRLQDSLIDATRIGPHVAEAALDQKFPATMPEREKALVLYRYVTGRLQSNGVAFSSVAAEDVFSSGEGSRTSALLALARATGMNAALVLARKIGHNCASMLDLDCYTQPLVRFWVGGEVIDADAEADDLAFGDFPASLDLHNALMVPLTRRAPDKPEIVALANTPLRERTVGEGDLFLDNNGNLSASIHVHLGASRAQEIRAVLRAGTGRQQQDLFEQLASRIFPGATDVQGRISHADDTEKPLELSLQCSVPQFISMQPGLRETGQLAPLLGLRNSFAKGARRSYPMLLNSVLSESTVFHLHLPGGVIASSLPHDLVIRNEFGEYVVKFSEGNGQLNVTREFHIPVQVVAADRFPAFLDFARRIDEAEHQRITLHIERASNDSSTAE